MQSPQTVPLLWQQGGSNKYASQTVEKSPMECFAHNVRDFPGRQGEQFAIFR